MDERTALASSPALQLFCEFETIERARHGAPRGGGLGSRRFGADNLLRFDVRDASPDARFDDDRYLIKDISHENFHGCHKIHIA